MSKLLKDGPFVLSFATHTMTLQMCEQDFDTIIIQVCVLNVRIIKKKEHKQEILKISRKKISKCIGMHRGTD